MVTWIITCKVYFQSYYMHLPSNDFVKVISYYNIFFWVASEHPIVCLHIIILKLYNIMYSAYLFCMYFHIIELAKLACCVLIRIKMPFKKKIKNNDFQLSNFLCFSNKILSWPIIIWQKVNTGKNLKNDLNMNKSWLRGVTSSSHWYEIIMFLLLLVTNMVWFGN